MTLNDLTKGSFATVTSINANKELKHRFNSFGIIQGATVHVERHSLAKQTMEIRINKTRIVLRNSEAEKMEIREYH